MRVLVVYRGLPWPITEGYHLRVLHLFRRLARRHEIHLLALIHEAEQAAKEADLDAEGIFSSIHLLWLPRRRLLGRLRTNLGFDAPAALHAEYPGFGRRIAERVGELCAERQLDCAYVFDPWAEVLYAPTAALLPSLLDVCDSRSLYYERRLEDEELGFLERIRTMQLLRRFRSFERYSLRAYPLAVAVSPEDRDTLLRLEPDARVEVIPNGVDLRMFAPLDGVEPETDRLLFFGNMDFLPNVDAARRFATAILPRVRDRRPATRFTIVGTDPVPEVRSLAKLPGVEVIGGVPDLRPWIARSAMLVAPLRFGAGIKNKLLETFAMERPVVTTSRAASALHPEAAELLVLAEGDEAFADAVLALLEDPQRRTELGRRAREVMRRRHSWDVAAARYEELLLSLAAPAPAD